ncbi:MAG: PAS domain-containing sensor histidine kinase, partial [Deltaproteobacteria bacterium]|nr:PAS domain-containing sensor histidine kinase [Deltaproteobacteria bacterium]
MLKDFLRSNIAIVGGGKFCKLFLDSLYSDLFKDQDLKVIGVADVNGRAEGLQYAKRLGIFTTPDFTE